MKKDKGTIFMPMTYILLLIFSMFFFFVFIQKSSVSNVSNAITDTMTDALLGCAVLDDEELNNYGFTGEVVIKNPNKNLEIYKDIIRAELMLDSNDNITNANFLTGKVRFLDFVIYSVNGNNITIYDFNESGSYTTQTIANGLGSIKSKTGKKIEGTSFYGELGFTVVFYGQELYTTRGQMVDIKKEN